MIWQTSYFAELEAIYAGFDLSYRTNINIYTDTDSLILNRNKCSKFLKFTIGEDLGQWNEERENFDITWKYEDYGAPIRKVIVSSKKTYFLIGDDNNLLCTKAKGIHTNEAKKITYVDVKKCADGQELKFTFEGLAKSSINLKKANKDMHEQDFVKHIKVTSLKKTLKRENILPFNIIKTSDQQDYELNKHCLELQEYKPCIKHYLIFTHSPLIYKFWQQVNDDEDDE